MKSSRKIIRILSTVFLSVLIALFILCISISIPLLFRGFYYLQIKSLNLVQETGFSEETIRTAYDEMMDYCIGGGEAAGLSFSTGSLAFTESGKAHFDDVARLFRLVFVTAIVTGTLLLLYVILRIIAKKTRASFSRGALWEPWHLRRRGPLFFGPSALLILFGTAGIYGAADYESFFYFFHHLFFPGKENWLFDRDLDEIIIILPDEVMQTFALIILGIMLLLCIASIISDILIGTCSYTPREPRSARRTWRRYHRY